MQSFPLSTVQFPMKIASLLTATVLAFAFALPAGAQDASETVKVELKKRIPEVAIESVRKIPFGNLYEVVTGGEIIYTDEKASFIVLGSIVNIMTKENVTEVRMRQINRVNFADLPLDSAIKIVRGNGARKVAIFEDPNCGYCKRFERDLAGVTDITVYVFLYPILSESSMAKSKAVWCAPDRAKAWLDTMVRDMVVNDGSCPAGPIEKNLAFGQSKRIQGTPTIIFEDGERVPGVMSMADFEKKLGVSKTPKISSAK